MGNGGNVSETALEARNIYKVFGRNPQQAVKRLKAGETRTEVQDVGTRANVSWSPGSLVLFR